MLDVGVTKRSYLEILILRKKDKELGKKYCHKNCAVKELYAWSIERQTSKIFFRLLLTFADVPCGCWQQFQFSATTGHLMCSAPLPFRQNVPLEGRWFLNELCGSTAYSLSDLSCFFVWSFCSLIPWFPGLSGFFFNTVIFLTAFATSFWARLLGIVDTKVMSSVFKMFLTKVYWTLLNISWNWVRNLSISRIWFCPTSVTKEPLRTFPRALCCRPSDRVFDLHCCSFHHNCPDTASRKTFTKQKYFSWVYDRSSFQKSNELSTIICMVTDRNKLLGPPEQSLLCYRM